ncbi:FAD linked oxidase-like protein [Lentzea atacamensis]|uniref:FAD linked oxidase-like protein n=1 Tax=Lentzea atacamensis TaxID=531938 RepID=A0ABX9E6L5_9PSEU|nr:FAD-linked oxidase C-terminal domain-containing protein [Lentzea atacamensis]RAS65004.1 FAD linked oxidase-like protein [Lentzea atacamensis]
MDLGGTVAGEHGVDLIKRDSMIRELGPDVCAVQHAVKDTLDPLHLFNPGRT